MASSGDSASTKRRTLETILENRGSAIHVPRAICRAERGRKDRVAAIEIPRFGQIASIGVTLGD